MVFTTQGGNETSVRLGLLTDKLLWTHQWGGNESALLACGRGRRRASNQWKRQRGWAVTSVIVTLQKTPSCSRAALTDWLWGSKLLCCEEPAFNTGEIQNTAVWTNTMAGLCAVDNNNFLIIYNKLLIYFMVLKKKIQLMERATWPHAAVPPSWGRGLQPSLSLRTSSTTRWRKLETAPWPSQASRWELSSG